jgi:hypothetical protein
MRTVKKVLPGQAGARKWAERYGDRFVSLRYCIDEKRKKRLKTVEIVVEECDWIIENRIPSNKIMHLRIKYGEIDLALAVKGAGGKWNRAGRYWELPYSEVKNLGLMDRIVD